jgi:hypothetical protein
MSTSKNDIGFYDAQESAMVTSLDVTLDALKRVEEKLSEYSVAINKLAEEVNDRGKVFFLKPGDIIRLDVFDPMALNYVMKVVSVNDDAVQLIDVKYGIDISISIEK